MLGGGNPARIPEMEQRFREEMDHLLRSKSQFENMVGNYDPPQGNQRFIDTLAKMLSNEFGWDLSAKNIAITNGSQASFGILFNLFSGMFPDGSFRKILLPLTPEYIGYSDVGIGNQNIFHANKPVIEFDEKNRTIYKYRVDFNKLEITDEYGAICISRPTNPTGNVITDNELKKLSNLAKESNIPLILDGAYGLPFPGIIFNNAKPIWDEHIILCLSLSKLGLPGTRTGIVIANSEVIEKLSSSNAIFSLAPGRFGPSLVTRLCQTKELISLSKSIIKPYYKRRVDDAVELVTTLMSDIPVKIHKPEGSMFLWLWFKDLPISSEILYQRLKNIGVYIISGSHFFPGLEDDWKHKEQCIRVSYAGDPQRVEKGIEIIAQEVRTAYNQ